ncbi:hypothetical protein N7517_003681 [Penicillium concentricum]|uniref:Uncharacterized protein n=1 Tax=Penicillium concentricum TaxID=293559 RepID=A0A9W9S4E0_9EURO|nr:uncharacterized protein N7517_003681 [Penicillium concentricum]KAJ5371675.1 hypothetical protein N7517_003681 [Penicillium concentricum]
MPPLNDNQQHERMLTSLTCLIHDLRFNPESRLLVTARLSAISRLARICAQFGKDARFAQLCGALQKSLPGQIALLKSDISSNVIVADALDRMIFESSLSPRSVVKSEIEKIDEGADQDVDADASDDESEMDSGDDNYIARLLLGSKWDKPIVDFDEEPYGEIEVAATDASEEESEIDPSDDDYISRLLLGPSWATPLADFAEEPYENEGTG